MTTWDYPKDDTAIAFDRVKDALLYFDYVVPFDLPAFFADARDKGISSANALSILPQSMRRHPTDDAKNPMAFLDNDLISYCAKYLCALPNLLWDNLVSEDEQRRRIDTDFPDVVSHFFQYLTKQGLENAALVHPFEDVDLEVATPALMLSNIKLIDTSKASLELLIELRKDEAAKHDLRRLRKFVYENYEGKGRAYIEDDLLDRIDKYHRVADKWKLETRYMTLTSIFSSAGVTGAISSLALSAFGTPLSAFVGAGSTAALEFGGILLMLRGRSRALRIRQSEDHMAYIIDAQNRLDGT